MAIQVAIGQGTELLHIIEEQTVWLSHQRGHDREPGPFVQQPIKATVSVAAWFVQWWFTLRQVVAPEGCFDATRRRVPLGQH